MTLQEKPGTAASDDNTTVTVADSTTDPILTSATSSGVFRKEDGTPDPGDQNDTNDEGEVDGDDGPTYLHGVKLFSVMFGMTIVMVLAMLDITIISTAIPRITSDFHRLEDVGWYVGAYQLSSATVQPLTGKLYTYFSTKWTYMIFFFIFEVGSAICGSATSSTMLIIGRSIAGLGTSGLMNGTINVLSGAIVPEKRPLYNGIAFGTSQIGIIAGPLLGGVLTEYTTWRWCFYINLPLGALAGVFLAFVNIRDQTPKSPVTLPFLRSILPRFDLTGFVLFAPAAIMFLLALQFGAAEYGWGSSEVIGLFVGSAVTLLVFLAWEWKMGDDAMFPLAMVRKRVIWSSSLNMAFLMSTNIVAGAFYPIYFQSVRGLSPVMSGVYFLPGIFSQIIAIVLSGALMVRFGYYIPWSIASGVAVAIAGGLISTWDAHSNLGHVFGYQVLLGIRGLGMQVGLVAIQNGVPPSQVAIASAILIFVQNFFAAVLVTVGNTLFQEGLVAQINGHVPGIDANAAIAAGGSAEAVRTLAPPGSAELAGLLDAYSVGVSHVTYLLLALGVGVILTSFGMGWVDLRKTKKTVVQKKPQAEKGDA